MANKRRKSDSIAEESRNRLIDADIMYKVVEGVRAGRTTKDIAAHIGLSVEETRILIKDIGIHLTERYMEFAEVHRAINHARLEYMYELTEPMADGTFVAAKSKDEDAIPTPDRHWVKMAVEIIKVQNDMTTPDANRIREAADRQDQTNYDVPQIPTLNSRDDLFAHAQKQWEEDWGVAPQILADYGEKDLIDGIRDGDIDVGEGDYPIDKQVDVLKKRLEKLQEILDND